MKITVSSFAAFTYYSTLEAKEKGLVRGPVLDSVPLSPLPKGERGERRVG